LLAGAPAPQVRARRPAETTPNHVLP